MSGNTKRYIAIDLAADCGKVVLASVTAGSVTTETVHEFPIPVIDLDGHSLWDVYAAYSEVLKGLSAIGLRKLPIESIGVDSWGPGIVCVAKDGSFLGMPRMVRDVLSDAVQARFFKRMERRELYETGGVNVLDSHAALQLFGLYREKSIALENAKHLLFIPEAFAFLLTGKRFTEFTSLYGAGLVDRRKGKLSKDVLSACKVRPKRFPSVVQPGTKVAKLKEGIAEVTGLGRIPVVAVAGSRIASSAAAGLSNESGSALLVSGAVSAMCMETASPVVNDQTFEMNFSSEVGAGGVNLLVKRIVGTDLLGRCLEAWHAAGRAYSPEDVARMAREGTPTSAQLDPEDPTLCSVSDAPAAIARYCSLRSMAALVDDAATVRLIYESVAEKIGDTFVKLQSVTPSRIKALQIVGEGIPAPVPSSGDAPVPSRRDIVAPATFSSDETGDSRVQALCGVLDPVFCQMVADECAVPVTVGPADAAVLGNILVQAGLTRQALSSSFTPKTYTPGL